MLTRKGKYGLKALSFLAGAQPEKMISLSDIATARDIPRKFLEAILGELRNAGFVVSRKGKDGGYRLARAPEQINMGLVVRAIDGPLAPIACASSSRYERCDDCDEKSCEVRRMMLEVRQAICDVLDNKTLADVLAQMQLDDLLEIPCPE
ncbi:Rrf2 family transcriptional regulator [Devosia sp. 2618]|uniref:RrF2 family transcriptional regulator n=1 Tax=Devosia sp. 2618 TaxID=3156454 RepID=UPI00339173B9